MRKWETITTIFFTSLVAISMQGAQAAKSFHTGNYRHRGETVTHAAPRKLGVGHSEGAPESQEKGKAKKDKDTPSPVPYYKPETSQPSAERVEPVSSPSVAPVNRATTAPSSEDKNGSPEGPIPSPSLALTLKPSLLSSPTFPINVPSAEPTSKSSSELTIGEAQGSSGETPETNDGSTSPSIFPSPEPTFELIASVPPTTNGQTPESNDGSNITLSPAPTNVPSPGPTSQSPFELIPNDPQEGSEQTPEDNDVSNESPTDEPKVEISSTAVLCEGLVDDIRKEEVWWEYSVELHNEGANPEDANAVIVLVEFELLAQIQDDLLSCDNPKLRRLAADFGISGLDYIPQDILLEEDCPEPKRHCFRVRGLMDIYLVPDAKTDVAIFETRKAIRDLMRKSDGLGVTELDKVEYLAPTLSDTFSFDQDSTNSFELGDKDGQRGPALIALVAIVSPLLLAFAAAAYYKQGGGKLTIDPKVSELTNVSSNLSGGESAVSPVSGMAPDAYALNVQDTMSAIIEGNSDSFCQDSSEEIIVSDSGYTDEDSREISYMHNMQSDSIDPVIGAKKMEDHSEDKDFLLDVDLPKELLPSPATPKQRNETETREEWDGSTNEGSVCGSSVNEGSDWAYSISEGSVEEIDAIL